MIMTPHDYPAIQIIRIWQGPKGVGIVALSLSFWHGVMALWGLLTVLSVGYVTFDIRHTPEDPVMKWGFVVITFFTGPVGAFLYVLGCREPLPGTHEVFIHVIWRQVLGSTMHCVAGDGLGIVAGAIVAAVGHWPLAWSLVTEYAGGFLFGWTIFQALFMKSMAGGSYRESLKNTVWPEFLSMNGVMAGMSAVMIRGMGVIPGTENLAAPQFWFVMGMALTAGLIVAFPINGWLVRRGLKHGMMTVRPEGRPVSLVSGLFTSGQAFRHSPDLSQHFGHAVTTHVGRGPIPTRTDGLWRMTVITLGVLGFGILVGLA